MKILFISRAYPPIVGGIENQNYELSIWLNEYLDVETIANKKGKKFLPFFLPFVSVLAVLEMRNYDALLLGDGVLGSVGWLVKLFYRKKPVICVIHGLDLTYKMGLYQKLWVGFFLKKIDRFIAVGNETARTALEKGFPKEKIVFIPNGVDTEKLIGNYSRKDLRDILKIDLEGKKVILTSGRLAKRKGSAWFVENVMPKLPENIIYIIAGDGPDKENIQKAIEKNNLFSRVKMLGYVSDEIRNVLMNTCDIFIQPNIKIEGDMEGFGISVIEAASCKLPVVASKIEGLQDAIKDGENGFLVEPYNVNGYVEKITGLLADEKFRKDFGEKSRQYVIKNYKWDFIASKYADEIKKQINA
ncbi:MAG: Glycosyl transferase, group 1 family [uncultured bacterium]|nr:MAG: Glycosyl transferase, group 1 family [uncultured bacterium]HBR71292.1 TetR family transcriptional regulator [Candidatus Moranbacteria bacterium]